MFLNQFFFFFFIFQGMKTDNKATGDKTGNEEIEKDK